MSAKFSAARPASRCIDQLEPVLNAAKIVELQQEVGRVQVDDSLVDYSLQIVKRTREHDHLSLGVSPRGTLALYHAAQAMAFLEGRSFCIPDDFKRLAVPAFAHRVVINARYAGTLKKAEQADQLLNEIVATVPVPV